MLAESGPICAHGPDPLGLPSLSPRPTSVPSLCTQRAPSVPSWGDRALVPLLGLLQPRHQPCLAASAGMAPCVKIRVWTSPWLEELTRVHTENLHRLVF